MDYKTIEKAVFDHLMAKHQKDSNFRFSIRTQTPKEGKSLYFVGDGNHGFLGFSLWGMRVNSRPFKDLINFVVASTNSTPRVQFEIKYIGRESDGKEIEFSKRLIETLQKFKGKEYDITGKPENTIIKLLQDGHDIPSLLNGLDKMIEFISPIVDEEIDKFKIMYSDWKGDRISEKEFDAAITKLNERLKNQQILPVSNKQIENTSPSVPPKFPLNQILYGPPGTGKTYRTVDHSLAILENQAVEAISAERSGEENTVKQRFDGLMEQKRIAFCTFHQSMGYEDFIEGIKPLKPEDSKPPQYDVVDGIFKRLCVEATFALKAWEKEEDVKYEAKKKAIKDFKPTGEEIKNAPKYVLIIDEINRGNVAQIFGELITLIEDDKRLGMANALSATLPYSHESFSVPPNLYLIGTMNTADRSVEALDTALRRRFAFRHMKPEHGELKPTKDGIDLGTMLKTINQRLEVLLDADHTIGHSWLMRIKDFEGLKTAFKDRVMPLLQEFFYNDYEKIGLVLGEGFVEVQVAKDYVNFAAFKNDSDLASSYFERQVFTLKAADAWTADDFKRIYPSNNAGQ